MSERTRSFMALLLPAEMVAAAAEVQEQAAGPLPAGLGEVGRPIALPPDGALLRRPRPQGAGEGLVGRWSRWRERSPR